MLSIGLELSNYAHRSGTDFTGDIDMKNNKIFSIVLSSDSTSAVNKAYVGSEISKINKSVDLTPFFGYVDSVDGSVVMTNDFNLINDQIKNVKDGTNNQDAATLKQLNHANSVIASNISKSYFNKDGTTSLTGI